MSAQSSIHSTEYRAFPELDGKVMVNAEKQDVTTVDYLVKTVFAGSLLARFLWIPTPTLR